MENFNKSFAGLGLLGLAILLLASSCNRKQRLGQLPAAGTDTTVVLPPTAPAAVDVNNVQVGMVLMRGQGRYESPTNNLNLTYRIHIEQGRRIWISAGAMGLEGVRVLATPTEFQAVNRLERNYIRGDYAALRQRLGINVDYQILEDLLLGNATTQSALYQPYQGKIPPDLVPATYVLRDARYLLRFFLNPQAKLERLQALTTDWQPLTEAIYSQFAELATPNGASVFARQLDVAVPPKATRVQLQHREVVLGAEGLTFAFSIPDGYEQIQ